MDRVLEALVSGLAQAAPLFLGASGLTLIFGVMRTFDFAYGALFMFGAYGLATILSGDAVSLPTFVLAVLATGVAVSLLAGAAEVTVYRRLLRHDHIITLLGSYALLLVFTGSATLIWGPEAKSQSQTKDLAGAVSVFGARVASYDLGLIGLGLVVGLGLWLVIRKTRLGLEMRAVAHDRTTAVALGVRAGRVTPMVFVLGGLLAGIAGAVSAPLYAINIDLAGSFILQGFIVVIIGGLGSVQGALVASLLLGVVNGALVVYAPSVSSFSLYLVTAAVLVLRPQGLFGAPEKSIA